MILSEVNNNLIGKELGKTVYDEFGRPLVIEGTKLRDGLLKGLLNHNIQKIYVDDHRTRDLVIEECIPIKLRVEATKQIKDTFESIKENTLKIDSVISENIGKFKGIVNNVTGELMSNNKAVSLLSSVKAYEDSIFNHSLNVMIYSLQVAINKGYSERELELLGLGALLHDVGKLMVPVEILNKESKLSDDEFDSIKDHAEIGFNILRKNYDVPLLVSHCAYQHHERIDGRGYPRQLKNNEIHDFAKIMAVADVFDAVTSDRVYRKAMLPHEGMELIYSGYGTQFDTEVVDLFKKSTVIYPLGMGVKLSNGYSGVVVKYDLNFTGRPIVRLLKDKLGNDLDGSKEIDMSKDLNIMILDSDSII